ncbi:MAG: ThuA domain-containing protein [Planctomycetota bacterium]|jgi:type 1 glutamine amidotransferase
MKSLSNVVKSLVLMVAGLAFLGCQVSQAGPGVVFEGKKGPGKGKHVVFVIGDDEYRSEDLMPMLAKIMAVHHGFKCTAIFSLDKETGEIDPGEQTNMPGLEVLAEADLMVIFTRFRELPDEQMKHIMDYTNSGKPIVGLRTATHAFNYSRNKDSKYAKWSFRSKDPQGGWGREVLGETWAGHYGHHNRESTRGVIAKGMEKHPVVQGCEDIWGPSDVYTITTLTGDSKPLVMGQVLVGMNPDDEVNTKKPPMPIAWTKTYTGDKGKAARVFTTTMGHSFDFNSEGFRRLLVNGCYWALEMEDKIPPKSKVDFVGKYEPNNIGMKKFKKGLKPSDHAITKGKRR